MSAGDQWDAGAPGGYPPPPARSGAVTGLAIVGFVLGGLMILCGILGFLGGSLLTGAGTAGSEMEARLQEELKRQGKTLPSNVSGQVRNVGIILTLYSVGCLIWGIMTIPGGIGMLNRRKWGR